MLKKLDNLLFKGLHLAILAFLLYGGIQYAPESPATLLLGFIAFIVFVWSIFDVIFKVNSYRTDKAIDRYYSNRN